MTQSKVPSCTSAESTMSGLTSSSFRIVVRNDAARAFRLSPCFISYEGPRLMTLWPLEIPSGSGNAVAGERGCPPISPMPFEFHSCSQLEFRRYFLLIECSVSPSCTQYLHFGTYMRRHVLIDSRPSLSVPVKHAVKFCVSSPRTASQCIHRLQPVVLRMGYARAGQRGCRDPDCGRASHATSNCAPGGIVPGTGLTSTLYTLEVSSTSGQTVSVHPTAECTRRSC
mmetsp:Transcript_19426/g.44763  ORF Transcript_19426/g.44763 Transcript_19426/m.44763 type:complete len:226 (+) Transcript_19426:78-755(+)